MHRFTVSLSDELADWVEEEADARGASKAQVIRDCVAAEQASESTEGGVRSASDMRARLVDIEERVEDLERTIRDDSTTESIGREPPDPTLDGELPSDEEFYEGSAAEAPDEELNDDGDDLEDVVAAFRDQMDDYPPESAHGTEAVVATFRILLEDGPLSTSEIQDRVYAEVEGEFSSARSMWQSIQRYFEEIPGIEKPEYGEWGADPVAVSQ